MKVETMIRRVVALFFAGVIFLLILFSWSQALGVINEVGAYEKTSNEIIFSDPRIPVKEMQAMDVNIEYANTSIELKDDLGIQVFDALLIKNEDQGQGFTTNFSIQINGLVTSLDYVSNLSLSLKISQGEQTSLIEIIVLTNASSWISGLVYLDYEIQDFIIPFEDDYLFSYVIPFSARHIGFIDIALPQNSQLSYRVIGGRLTPLVTPFPSYNYSDGIQTHLRWEPGDIALEQSIIIEYQKLTVETTTNSLTWVFLMYFFIGLGTGVLLTIISVYFWFMQKSLSKKSRDKQTPTTKKVIVTSNHELRMKNKEETKNTFHEKTVLEEATVFINLTDQERKIVYALMDLHKKASQESLRKHLGWGKSKLSTYIKRLEAKGIVKQIEVGRMKYVHLLKDVEF